MSPDAVADGPRRTRLVRAATLTSAMGLAWASTASGAPPSSSAPSFDHIGLSLVDADEESMRLLSPLPGRWQQLHEESPADREAVAPTSEAGTALPRGAGPEARRPEQAPEVTSSRQARPAGEQAATTRADAAHDRTTAAAKADGGRTRAAADVATEATGAEGTSTGKDAGTTDDASTATGRQGRPERAPVRTAQRAAVRPAPDPDAWRTNVVASHEGVELVQMSDRTVLVGFHEAAMPGAKPLTPASTPDANHGRGEVASGPGDDPLHTMVLPTRARTTGAGSAMDVVIPPGEAVFAPVTGTVTELDPYQLYGTHPDHRMVIAPDGRPDLRVVILHVDDVAVDVGDTVTAGQTRIAGSANAFPFESQVDRFAEPLMRANRGATPHVHVELR